jgi:hypothetical protein
VEGALTVAEFFKTDEGILHSGRIVATVYVIGFVGSCLLFGEFDRVCAARLLVAASWWLVLGTKQPPRTWSELTAHPLSMIGTALALLGIAAQFYFTWARHQPHP